MSDTKKPTTAELLKYCKIDDPGDDDFIDFEDGDNTITIVRTSDKIHCVSIANKKFTCELRFGDKTFSMTKFYGDTDHIRYPDSEYKSFYSTYNGILNSLFFCCSRVVDLVGPTFSEKS